VIRHVWTVLCSKASVDSQSNNISLFEVIESVQYKTQNPFTFPTEVPFMGTLVTLWARQRADQPVNGEMRVRLFGPDANELLAFNSAINLSSASRMRNLSSIQGLRIGGNGIHEWEISWRMEGDDWQIAAHLPLEISIEHDPTITTITINPQQPSQ
jgi:hypothetical protein